MFNLALPVDGCRTGLLGQLPVDADYLDGVRARARMLARACRLTDGDPGRTSVSTSLINGQETPEKKDSDEH